MSLNYPILVVSYNDESRRTLEASLQREEVSTVSCTSFLEAENKAINGIFNGVLVDLTSIVKAKGEEKLIACSLAALYPTLRVRTLGSMLGPMIAPGGMPQEGSLKDFLLKTCSVFTPRKLRAHRRHDLLLAGVMRQQGRESLTFTQDLSWGGAFFVDVHAERFQAGEELEVVFPEFDLAVPVVVRWKQQWGGRKVPGIGCEFLSPDGALAVALAGLLRSSPDHDRHRQVA